MNEGKKNNVNKLWIQERLKKKKKKEKKERKKERTELYLVWKS